MEEYNFNESVINNGRYTIIINGGNPLEGCPKSWEEAYDWEKKANDGELRKEYSKEHKPYWEWDCGFKLDYDGGLMRVSSRFYPPKTHYGKEWDGSVSIYLMNEEEAACGATFKCETLEQLKEKVEKYVENIKNKLQKYLKDFF